MALAFLLVFASAAGLAAVGLFGLLGRLPPNSLVGIRIGYTMASEQRWYDAHRGAGPTRIFGGVAIAAVNLAFLPFSIVGRIDTGVAVAVVGISAAALLLIVLQSALMGVRAAQAREE